MRKRRFPECSYCGAKMKHKYTEPHSAVRFRFYICPACGHKVKTKEKIVYCKMRGVDNPMNCFKVPNDLLAYGLSSAALKVYMYAQGQHPDTKFTQAKMAKDLEGIISINTIRKAVKELKEKGFILGDWKHNLTFLATPQDKQDR